MSKVSKIIIGLLAVVLITQMLVIPGTQPVKAAGNVYYVSTTGNDSNPGTLNAPFRTIQKGIDMAQAGDTVIVRGGTYYLTTYVNITKSGTPGNPITLAAYPGETPVIDGQDTYPNSSIGYYYNQLEGKNYYFSWDPLIYVRGSHITIDGITVQNSYGRGIQVDRYHYDGSRISNVTIKNCTTSYNRQEGILVAYTDYFTVENNIVNGNVDFHPGDHTLTGMNWSGGLDSDHSTHGLFKGNVIYNNWGEGLMLNRDTRYMTIEDNIVYDNWGLGIYIEESDYALVQRNLVYHTGDSTYFRNGEPCVGIQISDEDFGLRTSTNNIVINNFVKGHKFNFAFLWWSGMSSNASLKNTIIANNTFVDATDAAIYISDTPTPHVNSRFENNIVYESSGQLYRGDTTPSGIAFSNNNWSATPPSYVSSANDVIGNPQLTGGTVSANYFKLKSNSPCIGKGKNNLADVPYDFFGNARSNPPCIGGHEYSGASSTPTPAPTPMPGQLLNNPGFEEGTASWGAAWGGSIASETTTVYSGTKACRVYNRAYPWESCTQDVKSVLLANGPGQYSLEAWVKLASGSDTAGIFIRTVDSNGTHYFGAYNTTVTTNWTKLSWTGNISWTGTLVEAVFYPSLDASTADLYVDACSLLNASAPTPIPTPTPTPTPDNLISNPGFESGSAGWTLWENTSIVANNAHSGTYCIRTGTGQGGFTHSNITSGIYGNTDYYIEAWGKAASGNNFTVYIECMNSGGTTIQSFSLPVFNSTSYEKKSLKFTTPAGTTQIGIWAWKNGTSGYAYLDDFVLRRD